MKRTTQVIALLMTAALSVQHATSQEPAPLPAEIEGPLGAVVASETGVTLQVMDMTVIVPDGIPISSPSNASLGIDGLLDVTPLPGRIQEGFIGGTAIITGTVDAAGVTTADSVFIEPAENVVVGVVTANEAGALSINQVPITLSTDPRMPAEPVRNAFGFEINPVAIAVGTPASAEGYFAAGTFYAFLVEIDDVGELTTTSPQVSILRAQSRERVPNDQRGDEVEVRGGVTTGHASPEVATQTLEVYRVDGSTATLLGTAIATVDPETPGVAEWRFRTVTPPSADPVLGSAPTVYRVVNISPGALNASAQASADIIAAGAEEPVVGEEEE